MEKVGKEFDNCKYEFDHAFLSKKEMIPIVMEAACKDVKNEWFGRVKAALGTKLYLDFSNDSKFDEFMTNLKSTLIAKVGQPTPGTAPNTSSSPSISPPPPAAVSIERAHAYFLMLQPLSAPISSYLKLRTELDNIKEFMSDSKLSIILKGGNCKDRPIALAKVVIVCAEGIDESALCGNDNYLKVIVNMKPEVVVLCMTHGAERIGERLSQEGIKTVCWMRLGMRHVDLQDLCEYVLLPFCKDVLIDNKSLASSFDDLKKNAGDELCKNSRRLACEYGSFHGTSTSSTSTNTPVASSSTLGNDLIPCGVKVKMADLGSTKKMFGFKWEELADAAYRHSYLPSINDIEKQIKQKRQMNVARNSPQFIDVKMQTGASAAMAHDLMQHICMSVVDDESLKVKGVYRVVPTQANVPPSELIVAKDELFARIGQMRDTVVLIDGMRSVFPEVKDLREWLYQFRRVGATFLFSSDNDDDMEPYIEAMKGRELRKISVWSVPALFCDLTGQRIQPTPYQATIRVSRDANLPDKRHPDLQDIASLKKITADLADTTAPRTEVLCSDDGSTYVNISVSTMDKLKGFFHGVIDIQQSKQEVGVKFSIDSALALYEEAALKLNTLNDEQVKFVLETWNNKSNRVVHLKGAAGTGKTFVALHCALEHLGVNTSRQQSDKEKVLLVCPNVALCCFFARWLLARVERNDYERKKLLGNITFLVLNEGQGQCKAFQIEINSQDDLDVVDKNIERIEYAAFGLIIVDESQAVFHSDFMAMLPSSFRDAINTNDDSRKVLLLSDTSQAACTEDEINLPRTVNDTFVLRTVSRCSENITAATLPYQLGERSKCNHGIKGPRVKVDLFGSKNDTSKEDKFIHFVYNKNDINPELFRAYASRVEKAIANIKERFNEEDGEGANLHKRIAVTAPDETFRQELVKTGLFNKAGMRPVRALDAMMKSGIGSSVDQPWIIVDTPPKLNGLEFPFVIVVGLDSPVEDDDPRGNKIVQSCIYRGTSRAYCIAYLINHVIEGGWFEWLLKVVAPNIRENKSLPSAENNVPPPPMSHNTSSNGNAKSSFDIMGEAVNGEAVTQLVDTSSIRSKKGNQNPNIESSEAPFSMFWYGDTFDISVPDTFDRYFESMRLKFLPAKTGTDSVFLQDASDNLKTNESYVLAAVEQDGWALQYASPDLRANEAIVKVAVEQVGEALQFASPALRANEAIVKVAVEQDGWAFEYASPAFRADEAIVKAAVKLNGYALQFASPALRANEDIVKAAVEQNGAALEYASPALQADEAIVKAAVEQDGEALKFASPGFQANEAIVKVAVQRNGYALQYASPTLREDKDFVNEAVERKGYALKFASPALQADEAILKAAGKNLRENPHWKAFVSDELKSNQVLTEAAGGWD